MINFLYLNIEQSIINDHEYLLPKIHDYGSKSNSSIDFRQLPNVRFNHYTIIAYNKRT